MLLPASFLLALALTTAPAASDDASVRQDLAIGRAQIQADRKSIVAASLPLGDAQAKGFWPLYDEYRAEMEKLGDKGMEIVLEYARDWNADTLTDARATDLLDRHLQLQADEIAVRTKWAKKFRTVLPGSLVARFYQIENRLDLIVREDVASGIPLMPSAKK